jgi:CDP-diacylglycerol pyrophosphatase
VLQRILLLALIIAGGLLGLHALSANRDALRQIVQQQCLVHWRQLRSAAPCERIYLPQAQSAAGGYALLADRKGGAHFLLIPTQTIVGIESPEVLDSSAPNYFAAAWQGRDLIAARVGHSVSRSAVGLALNPKQARSQDQLHIHMECLRTNVAAALRESAASITTTWSSLAIDFWHYDAMRIMGEELGTSNPFKLLAARLPKAMAKIESYTLIVAGMDFPEGPGFVVLAGTGMAPAGELLLDSNCAVAGGLAR